MYNKTYTGLHIHNNIKSKTNLKAFYQENISAEKVIQNTHTHNRFTALLEHVRDHLGEQVPER